MRKKEWDVAGYTRQLYCCGALRSVTAHMYQEWHDCRACTLGVASHRCCCYVYDATTVTYTCTTCGDIYHNRTFTESPPVPSRAGKPVALFSAAQRWAAAHPALSGALIHTESLLERQQRRLCCE